MENNILDDYSTNHTFDFKLINEQIDKLKVVAHPVRFAILVLLVKNKKMTVTEIYRELSIHQAAVSNHLKLMKDSGILYSERCGQNTFYSVNDDTLLTLYECLKLGTKDKIGAAAI